MRELIASFGRANASHNRQCVGANDPPAHQLHGFDGVFLFPRVDHVPVGILEHKQVGDIERDKPEHILSQIQLVANGGDIGRHRHGVYYRLRPNRIKEIDLIANSLDGDQIVSRKLGLQFELVGLSGHLDAADIDQIGDCVVNCGPYNQIVDDLDIKHRR